MLDLLGVDREVMCTWRQAPHQRIHYPWLINSLTKSMRGRREQLASLMGGHPVEKPWIRLILYVDLQINEETPLKQTCASTKTFLSNR